MTTFLAGFAIGTQHCHVDPMGTNPPPQRSPQTPPPDHPIRPRQSLAARAVRYQRNLNYAGSFDGLENLRPELVRPYTVEHAEPAHWDELSTELAVHHHDGGES